MRVYDTMVMVMKYLDEAQGVASYRPSLGDNKGK